MEQLFEYEDQRVIEVALMTRMQAVCEGKEPDVSHVGFPGSAPMSLIRLESRLSTMILTYGEDHGDCVSYRSVVRLWAGCYALRNIAQGCTQATVLTENFMTMLVNDCVQEGAIQREYIVELCKFLFYESADRCKISRVLFVKICTLLRYWNFKAFIGDIQRRARNTEVHSDHARDIRMRRDILDYITVIKEKVPDRVLFKETACSAAALWMGTSLFNRCSIKISEDPRKGFALRYPGEEPFYLFIIEQHNLTRTQQLEYEKAAHIPHRDAARVGLLVAALCLFSGYTNQQIYIALPHEIGRFHLSAFPPACVIWFSDSGNTMYASFVREGDTWNIAGTLDWVLLQLMDLFIYRLYPNSEMYDIERLREFLYGIPCSADNDSSIIFPTN